MATSIQWIQSAVQKIFAEGVDFALPLYYTIGMIEIDKKYVKEVSFDEAVATVSGIGSGDLLHGLKTIKAWYECIDPSLYDKNVAWMADEINAYNAVFAPMQEMFHGKVSNA